MSIYIRLPNSPKLHCRACFGGLYDYLHYSLSERNGSDWGDPDDDEYYDYDDGHWDNAGGVVYFCGADRARSVDKGSYRATAKAWKALVSWFFNKYSGHYILDHGSLLSDKIISELFRGDGSDSEHAVSIGIDVASAIQVDESYLPLACHIIRLPYIYPQAVLYWHDMVKAGFLPEDALRLSIAITPVVRGSYTGVDTVGWTPTWETNGDRNVPFGGSEFAMAISTTDFCAIPHSECYDLSFHAVDTAPCPAIHISRELDAIYKAAPHLEGKYGRNPVYTGPFAAYSGVAVVVKYEGLRYNGILVDEDGTPLSLLGIRKALYGEAG